MSEQISPTFKYLVNEYALIYKAMNDVIDLADEFDEPLTEDKLYPMTLRRMEGRVNPVLVRRCVQIILADSADRP